MEARSITSSHGKEMVTDLTDVEDDTDNTICIVERSAPGSNGHKSNNGSFSISELNPEIMEKIQKLELENAKLKENMSQMDCDKKSCR